MSLAITAPDAATLAFDALGLGTVDAAHTALLASLDQYLPDTLNLTRQPDDGEVRLRLLLPVPDASLTAEALEEPIGLLLAMAPVFRLALPLVQQGLSPEEAIQRAQAAPAPEAAAVPPAIPEALRTLLQELVQLQGHDDRHSLERQRELCQTMLAQLPRQDNHELWAAIHVELGNSCQRLYDITGELTHAQDATEAYQAALEVRTRAALPTAWAMTQHNLANVYRIRYERSGEERWASLATEAYQAALSIFTPTVAPVQAQSTGHRLGDLSRRRQRWSEAHQAYSTALVAAEHQYLAAPGDSACRHFMAAHAALYRADAACLLALEQHAQAWVRLEQGRARALGEVMGLDALAELHHGPGAVDALRTLRRAVQQADAAYQTAEGRFLAAPTQAAQDEATLAQRQARQALETAYAALRDRMSTLGLEPEVLDSVALLGLPLPPHTAAVTLLLTPEASQGLILYAGTVRVLALPATCTLTALAHLVAALPPEVEGWIDTYDARIQAQRALAKAEGQTALSAAQDGVAAAAAAWNMALESIAASASPAPVGWYVAYRLAYDMVRGENHPQAERAALSLGKHTVERTMAFLAEQLWPSLVTALPPEVTQVLWVPSGVTALLPVHAAAPAHLSVAYTPSPGIWQQCAARTASAAEPTTAGLFLVTPATDLFFT